MVVLADPVMARLGDVISLCVLGLHCRRPDGVVGLAVVACAAFDTGCAALPSAGARDSPGSGPARGRTGSRSRGRCAQRTVRSLGRTSARAFQPPCSQSPCEQIPMSMVACDRVHVLRRVTDGVSAQNALHLGRGDPPRGRGRHRAQQRARAAVSRLPRPGATRNLQTRLKA